MGQSKQRRDSFAKMLADRRPCIYCAGASIGDTIEHMPPRAMFEGRQRPGGLEFTACEACNTGTKQSDAVASLFAHIWPKEHSSIRHDDLKRLLSGVANNLPELLREMDLGRRAETLARKRVGIPDDAHPLRIGPIANHHMYRFAAKLGFALHQEVFGKPIPVEGGVQVMWFSNVQAMNDEIPIELTAHLPAPLTLRQGSKTAEEQFRYSFNRTDDGSHMLYMASFNLSFAVAGITAIDRSTYLEQRPPVDHMPVFVPGFAKG